MKKNIPMKRQRMNPALARMTLMQRDSMIMKATNKAMLLLAMMVLHDKFGFGKKRLEKFLEEYRKQLEAYNEGYIESVKDFENVLWEECGIKIDEGIGGEDRVEKSGM